MRIFALNFVMRKCFAQSGMKMKWKKNKANTLPKLVKLRETYENQLPTENLKSKTFQFFKKLKRQEFSASL